MEAYARKIKLKKNETQYHQKLKIHTENLKQKISALGNRLRRYHERAQRYQENNIFSNNQRQFFRKLDEQKNESASMAPSPTEMQKYWKSIWPPKDEHKTNTTWIEREKEEHNNLREMISININEKDVEATVRRMKNWTTPGIDGIHNYWWKSFTHTNKALARLINGAIEDPRTILEYFTHSSTLILPKKGDLTRTKNYRPITCLPSANKIITSTIGHKIQMHLRNNNVRAWEQNGCKNKGRGSKELLVIDNILTKQPK